MKHVKLRDLHGSRLEIIIRVWLRSEPQTWQELIGRMLIKEVPRGCRCRSLTQKMDDGGLQWCLDRRRQIVLVMVKNAIKGTRWPCVGRLMAGAYKNQAELWFAQATKNPPPPG